MGKRTHIAWLSVAVAAWASFAPPAAAGGPQAPDAASTIGRRIESFTLADFRGKKVLAR